MKYISVDVEADGPFPGEYSMISLGAVVADGKFEEKFYIEIKPISENYILEALTVSGFSREQTLKFNEPEVEIIRFNEWLKFMKTKYKSIVFASDNNGFDWQFVNYYLHKFSGENPFGHSSMNINWFYKGLEKDIKAKFKKYRITKHSHNALEDALGNAEALYTILKLNNMYG